MKSAPSSISLRISKSYLRLIFSLGLMFLAIPNVSAQSIFNGPRDYVVGSYPDSVVVGDFNGDGLPDVAVANQYSASISVLLGNSDGTFQTAVPYTVGNGPTSLQVGDLNGDGKPDLVVLNSQDNTISVLLNSGNGTFAAQQVTSLPAGAGNLAVGNFNGDAYLDVAVPVPLPQAGTFGVGVLLGKGDGTFQPIASYAVSAQARALSAADFNNDGKLDLVASTGNLTSNAISVLLGNGDGTFQAAINTPLTFSTSGLVVADFNQDGNLDIATAAGSYPTYKVVLLYGNGNGTFQVQQPLSLVGVPLAAGDLNGDGKPDLIAAPSILQPGANTIQSLLNNGDGTFTILQSLPGAAVSLYDLLGDQKLDLIAAQAAGSPGVDQCVVSIVRGNGDGTFATFPFYPGGAALAAADFNGDQKIDLAEQIVTLTGGNDYTEYVGVSLNSGGGFPPPTQIQIQGQSPYNYGAIGDFNGDGHMDLAAATSEVGILLGNGDGTFQNPVYYGAGMVGPIATGDFNKDGKLDVFGASGANVSVLLGNGDGTFGLPVNSFVGQLVPLTNVAVADFNQDKKLDAAVVIETSSAPYSQVALLLGNGDGTFSPGEAFNFNFPQTAIATGDLNGDGIPDLIVAVSGGTDVQVFPASVVVFLGKGDGTFQSPITTSAGDAISTVVVADFNGDGKQDVAISSATWGDVSLLLGNGDGTFQVPMQFSSGGGAIVVADFDGNGRPDLAVSGNGGVYLLLNTGNGGSAALVSPTALTFASQTVGQASAAQTVILSNTSSTSLSISGVATSGGQSGDFQQTNTCGTSLAAGATCTISVTFTPQAAGAGAAAIQITDNAINSPQMISLSGTGIAPPDFTFGTAPGGSSSTISAGQTATFTLALTASGSFSGTVNLTCSIAPAAAPAPVCSVPGSVSVTGTSATSVMVTVSTTASGSVAGWPSAKFPIGTGLIAWMLALGFSSLLFVTKRSRPAVPAAIIVLAFLAMAGCGGSSSTPPSRSSKGTPAGTYTATLTATSGSLSHQVPLTVIVQ
jgi:hypothetical protein